MQSFAARNHALAEFFRNRSQLTKLNFEEFNHLEESLNLTDNYPVIEEQEGFVSGSLSFVTRFASTDATSGSVLASASKKSLKALHVDLEGFNQSFDVTEAISKDDGMADNSDMNALGSSRQMTQTARDLMASIAIEGQKTASSSSTSLVENDVPKQSSFSHRQLLGEEQKMPEFVFSLSSYGNIQAPIPCVLDDKLDLPKY